MKMRKHHCARLKHAKGQIFTCGMFGTCSDSVLSPRTPPALVISSPVPPNTAAKPQSQPQQQQVHNVESGEPPKSAHLVDGVSPPSPDTVKQEKLLSQWDFGLKQIKEIKDKDAKAPEQPKDLPQQQQQEGFFKERYVGLVDRDLSPFQFPRAAAPLPPLPPPPAPPAPPPRQDLESLTREASTGRLSKSSLRCIRALAEESERNKRFISGTPLPQSLISLLLSTSPELEKRDVLREALALLALLADDEHIQSLISASALLLSIQHDLRRRSVDAWILICKLSTNESLLLDSSSTGILEACVLLLKDPSAEAKLVRLALKAMLGICLTKQNRVPAVRAGAVEALLETLIDLHGVDGGDFCNRAGIVVNVERALATLELLCTSSEGRAAICNQPSFISELVGLVLGVSERATEYAAGVLCAVLCDNLDTAGGIGGIGGMVGTAGGVPPTHNLTLTQLSDRGSGTVHSWNSSVQELAVKGGAPAQMLLVMQSDCSERARRKAAKLLKALHKYGEDHHTIHSDLASTITY